MKKTQLQAWIEQVVAEKHPGWKLPTAPELARTFGVSTRTVARALKPFADRGELIRIQGKGTYLPPGPETQEMREAAPSAAERIAAQLESAIVHGEYKNGEALPSLKLLSMQFRISYKTAVDAYRLLTGTGLVSRMGKTCWVGQVKSLVTPPRFREVYLVLHESLSFSQLFATDHAGLAWRKMEQELYANGCRVNYAGSQDFNDLCRTWAATGQHPYALVFCHTFDDRFRELQPGIRLLTDAMGGHEPVMLAHTSGPFDKGQMTGLQQVDRLSVLEDACGTLSRYLLGKGIRDAVLFMHQTGNFWSYFAPQLQLLQLYWTLKKSSPDFTLHNVIKENEQDVRQAGESVREKLVERNRFWSGRVFKSPHADAVRAAARETVVTDDYTKLFERFASRPFWIFSRDADAVMAMAWAEERGIRVPSDLAVMTLENNPEYFVHGLSYCTPDWDTIGYQMAHAVLQDHPVAKNRKGHIRTDAVVVEKRTT